MKHQHAFAEDLAALLRAGTPLEQSLGLLEQHHPSADFKTILAQIKQSVQQGLPLSDSLQALNKEQNTKAQNGKNSKSKQAFSELFIGMVKSGEASADLPAALSRLAEQLDRDNTLKQKIKSSLVYPAILVIGMFVSLIVMFAVVVPQFSILFNEHADQLSPLAAALMHLGGFINAWGIWLLAALVLVGIGVWRSANGLDLHSKTHSLLQKIPSISDLYNQIGYARFCYSLSSLLGSGLSQTQALRIASASFEQASNREQVDDVINQLNAGHTLGDCFPKLRGINPLFAHSIANAERAGELPQALDQLASRMEKDFSDKTLRIAQIIEPAMIMILGLVIGVIVYALFSSLASVGNLAL